MRRTFKKDWQYHTIIALPIIWFIIFRYWPMYGAQIAFRNFMPAMGIVGSPWVGFKNFITFFKSYQFGNLVRNTLIINIYGLIAGFPVPILLALMLNSTKNVAFKKTVQMATYAPHFISTVVMVSMIIYFLSPTTGLYGQLAETFGFEKHSLLGNPELFSTIYVWTGVWQTMGWSSIIYIAALSSVDPNLYDAASVDGASRFQRVRFIDFPSILPTVAILFILSTGRIMNIGFEKIYLMQNDLNRPTSEVLQTYIYKQSFRSSVPDYSYAASIGLFNSLINFVIIIIVNKVAKKIGKVSLW